ncbi:MAG: M42 family metallopeptidase [Candidatus Anstonellales archaeon]
MADVGLIAKLSEAFGIPGREEGIVKVMREEFEKAGLEVEIDRFGNVIARGKEAGKRPLMFGAHMDEIGMMVKHITDKGFIKFIKVGGIDNRTLVNQRIIIQTKNGNVYGVIGSKPPHLMKEEEMKSAIDKKNLFIDVGAKSKKDAESIGICIGDPICFDMKLQKLANSRITGKALDDRIGCYILLELAKRLKGSNILFVGTAQEEVSTFGKGAKISAYNEEPSAFVAVDTSIAGDHPEVGEDEAPLKLDGGPAITFVEAGGRGNVADRKLLQDVITIAKKAKVPVQLEVIEGGATDAASVYNVRGGIPSIAICVPTRYIHSNVQVCSLKDVDRTIDLLVAVGKNLKV